MNNLRKPVVYPSRSDRGATVCDRLVTLLPSSRRCTVTDKTTPDGQLNFRGVVLAALITGVMTIGAAVVQAFMPFALNRDLKTEDTPEASTQAASIASNEVANNVYAIARRMAEAQLKAQAAEKERLEWASRTAGRIDDDQRLEGLRQQTVWASQELHASEIVAACHAEISPQKPRGPTEEIAEQQIKECRDKISELNEWIAIQTDDRYRSQGLENKLTWQIRLIKLLRSRGSQ